MRVRREELRGRGWLRVAHHEAAHLVVGDWCGIRAKWIRLYRGPGGRPSGTVHVESRRNPHSAAIFLVAGDVAERHFHGYGRDARDPGSYKLAGWERGGDGWQLRKRLFLDDWAIHHVLEIAESIVEALAPAIDAVAHALLRADFTGEEALEIARVAWPHPHWSLGDVAKLPQYA